MSEHVNNKLITVEELACTKSKRVNTSLVCTRKLKQRRMSRKCAMHFLTHSPVILLMTHRMAQEIFNER